jgi:fusion and transport protein UGO1
MRRADSLLDVVRQLWTKEGAWGLWKGTNATFVHNFFLKTLENWIRSFLAALLNVPDPGLLRSAGAGVGVGGLDVVDSPNPVASVGVVVAAAGIAAAILTPLDLIRTRLILTSVYSPPRNLIPSLRQLPSLSVTSPLMPITIIQAAIPRLMSASAPIFLRRFLGIDPISAPATYSSFSFLTSTAELFVKLPLETVLRRAQGGLLRTLDDANTQIAPGKSTEPNASGIHFRPVIDMGPYRGIAGTIWYIVREEGAPKAAVHGMSGHSQKAKNKPQLNSPPPTSSRNGLHGLWRGWRVGFWGLVGVWGASTLGGGSSGGEF